MREGNGFLLVYSIASRSTFDNISTFKDKILRAKDVDQASMYVDDYSTCILTDLDVCSVLVGNKCDLDSRREVSVQEGQALAQQWGCAFMETSAKDRVRPLSAPLRHKIITSVAFIDKQ